MLNRFDICRITALAVLLSVLVGSATTPRDATAADPELPEAAPFDAIIVTAAPPHVPQPLLEQLAEGGRMVIPVGTMYQELLVLEKTAAGVVRRSTIPVRFVPMTGEAQQ